MRHGHGPAGGGEKKLKRSPRRRYFYRLAVALGIADVEAWLDSITPEQAAYWEAFGEIESFGEEAADLRVGMLISALDQMLAGEESQAKPEQFSMRFKGKRKKKGGKKVQSASKQLAAFRSVMDFHAAAVRANNG